MTNESNMKGNECNMKVNECKMKGTWEEMNAKWKVMKGNENNRWHPLTLDQGCFHTHFLSTGSSPPEKTMRVKTISWFFGDLKRYVFFLYTPICCSHTPSLYSFCPRYIPPKWVAHPHYLPKFWWENPSTLWLFNIAMENHQYPFLIGKPSMGHGFHGYVSHNQRVINNSEAHHSSSGRFDLGSGICRPERRAQWGGWGTKVIRWATEV